MPTSIWDKLGQDIDGEAGDDFSGYSVSLSSDGTIVAIGAPYNDGNDTSDSNRGHVRVYKFTADTSDSNGGSWNKLGQDIDGEASDDYSGLSVSLSSDGTIVAIGAIYNDGNGPFSGRVRVYKLVVEEEGEINYDKKVAKTISYAILSIKNTIEEGVDDDKAHLLLQVLGNQLIENKDSELVPLVMQLITKLSYQVKLNENK